MPNCVKCQINQINHSNLDNEGFCNSCFKADKCSHCNESVYKFYFDNLEVYKDHPLELIGKSVSCINCELLVCYNCRDNVQTCTDCNTFKYRGICGGCRGYIAEYDSTSTDTSNRYDSTSTQCYDSE